MKEELLVDRDVVASGSASFLLEGADSFYIRCIVQQEGSDAAANKSTMSISIPHISDSPLSYLKEGSSFSLRIFYVGSYLNKGKVKNRPTSAPLETFTTLVGATKDDTYAAVAAAINDLSTGSQHVSAEVTSDQINLISKIPGMHGNRISVTASSPLITLNSNYLSGAVIRFPEEGATSTVSFDVFANLTSLEKDLGVSLVDTQTDNNILFSFSDTKGYRKITCKWSGMSSGSDITIYIKRDLGE